MAGTEFYEIRCENCRTSFPPETKRCIHCGGPLGGGLATLLRQRQAAGGRPMNAREEQGAARAPVPIAAGEDEEELPQAPGRSLIWVITAMIAVGISMLRACMEG